MFTCRLIVLVVFILGLFAPAQQAVLEENNSKSRVEFFVSITGRDGAPSTEVAVSNLKVIDNGKNQDVISLKPAKDLPLALGVLLDSSLRNRPAYGSVISMADEQSILSESLSSWVTRNDKLLLVRFAEDSPNLAADIHLSDMAWMQQVVSFGTRRDAGTDMLQAIEAYRRELGNPHEVRQTLIVVANGGTFLSNEPIKRIVEVALRNNISIEVIDTCPRTARYGSRGPGDNSLRNSHLPEQVSYLNYSVKQVLKELAGSTGGIYVEVLNKDQLRTALTKVHESLNGEYVVAYSASQSDGQFHTIQVRALKRDITVRAPKGYYASAP